MADPFPYRLQYGYMCSHELAFATFAEALAAYRGFKAGEPTRGCRIMNYDRRDGSEDGNPSGLSDEEREALEEIG